MMEMKNVSIYMDSEIENGIPYPFNVTPDPSARESFLIQSLNLNFSGCLVVTGMHSDYVEPPVITSLYD